MQFVESIVAKVYDSFDVEKDYPVIIKQFILDELNGTMSIDSEDWNILAELIYLPDDSQLLF